MRLLFVRHGQTDWNKPARAQGSTDIPLNETGRAQAAALGRALKDEAIDRVLCSDLGRAQETARAVGRIFELRHDLRERSYGEWEGEEFIATNERIAALGDKWRSRPPGGESVEDVWNRCGPVVEELRAYEGTTLVISHGGTIAAIVARLILANLETTSSLHFANCALTELFRRPDGLMEMKRYSEPVPLT